MNNGFIAQQQIQTVTEFRASIIERSSAGWSFREVGELRKFLKGDFVERFEIAAPGVLPMRFCDFVTSTLIELMAERAALVGQLGLFLRLLLATRLSPGSVLSQTEFTFARHQPTAVAIEPNAATSSNATGHGLRAHHRRLRSRGPAGRASIARPESQRSRSSRNCSAEA
ncbi:MAG: hypothetical protein U0798_04515 [Gemmataceae bacterium]